jgi:S-adenosylmethionine synthetase
MTVVIESLRQPAVASRRVELVERKGLGHPDSICDALVEAIAIALNRMYRERTGAVLHYNIDKALLAAGQCETRFGWGEVTGPMTFYVGDRATFDADGVKLPVEDTLHEAVDGWLSAHLPRVRPGEGFHVRSVLAPGAVELRDVMSASRRVLVSNDTSGASGHAPLSPTERTVLAVERFLNGPAFKARFPDTGEDVKVFGVREDERVALTVAMPLLCFAASSETAYFARKEEILGVLEQEFRDTPLALEWRLNALDTPGHGADGAYLTVTGTSAEHGDSGQVGRGNRANGLIAFARPAGGEATAGKNAVAHPGKVYSVLTHHLANRIHARCPDIVEVYVHMAARIGDPIDRPWTSVQVILPARLTLHDVEPAIRDVVEAELARLSAFREELLRGAHPVC